jgi:hypothetical protein
MLLNTQLNGPVVHINDLNARNASRRLNGVTDD